MLFDPNSETARQAIDVLFDENSKLVSISVSVGDNRTL